MAKRSNYSSGKRQTEIRKQKKREQKIEKKRIKKEGMAGGDQSEVIEEDNGDLTSAGIAPDDSRVMTNASNAIEEAVDQQA